MNGGLSPVPIARFLGQDMHGLGALPATFTFLVESSRRRSKALSTITMTFGGSIRLLGSGRELKARKDRQPGAGIE